MEHLKIILPIALLAIGFLLKMVVSREWKDIPNIIQNICELPVDIIFLALSFSVAFTISNSENHDLGLLFCFVGIAISILILLIRKISMDLFNVKKHIWIFLFLINLLLSSFSIRESIKLMNNDGSTIIERMINKNPDSLKEEGSETKYI